ncbi:jerky protein homolog-like [Paramacrobiotus metropolitanus]|uniref:jerky protein homolog-like n=1 Tax=Paramacrobiotus metropolitanus TaxID=2943436 RepID=UPI002445E1DE|nr:jerky protein homolog-like [Paramacrobiotus metropolitanus]
MSDDYQVVEVSAGPKKPRNHLTLEKKLEIIQAVDEGLSYRQIGTKFGISHSSVTAILKARRKLERIVKEDRPVNRKRIFTRMRFERVDTLAWRFFSECRTRHFHVSGVMLKSKAKQIADNFGISDFAASNGWLESFRQRHNISFRNLAEEAGFVGLNDDVRPEVYDQILHDIMASAGAETSSSDESETEQGPASVSRTTTVKLKATDSYKDVLRCLTRIEHFVAGKNWRGGELLEALKTLLIKERSKERKRLKTPVKTHIMLPADAVTPLPE